jgi:hypothetical protein
MAFDWTLDHKMDFFWVQRKIVYIKSSPKTLRLDNISLGSEKEAKNETKKIFLVFFVKSSFCKKNIFFYIKHFS